MKYKVGDRVKIREDLIIGHDYGSNDYINDMDNIAKSNNYILTISDYSCNNKQYRMVEAYGQCWNWTDEMIEGLVGSTDREKFEGWMRKLAALDSFDEVWLAFLYCAEHDSDASEYDDNLKAVSDYLFGAEKKKMTQAEIEAELGYEIEIVKE